MNQVLQGTEKGLPIKIWGEDIEETALEQAKNLAQLPFAFKWIALMPDCHMGYGMPIGGVMATQGVVVPNAVGVDIGCGMRAIQTNVFAKDINEKALKEIMGQVRKTIPVGFNHNKGAVEHKVFDEAPDFPIINQQLESARKQIGTLGGGNHFIELQVSESGYLWLMIHSGSRNFGYKIAQEYHKVAKLLCTKWRSDIPTVDLSFLPMGTKEATGYWHCMNFALEFSKANREVMMNRFMNAVLSILGTVGVVDEIDVHHNYARYENHFGENVIIHRKGAISAKFEERGIIPGSQGTCSYITRGHGNIESFKSSSHGAGRIMSRTKARKELDLDEEINSIEAKGVIHSIRSKEDLDEAPGAYKNIEDVIAYQKDLVMIEEKLTPLGVIKG
jgi:tRNA-splicing ligase RtcB